MLTTYLTFTCTDLQNVNTKYFEKPLIVVITCIEVHEAIKVPRYPF